MEEKMNKKLIDEKSIIKYIIIILSFFFLFNPIITHNCTREFPILKDGNCVLENCTEDEFKNETCVIVDQIVKTQWLNDIIWIGEQNFRYINFAKNTNGDMVVETTSFPASEKRLFYGIYKDGNPFFKDNNFFNSISVQDQTGNKNKGRYEGEIFFFKINDNEFLVSIGKNSQYVEVYDFDNKQVWYQTPSYSLFGKVITGLSGAVIIYELNENGISTYYLIFGFISNSNFCLKKMNSLSTSLNEFIAENVTGSSVSCFMTDSQNIICFYLEQLEEYYFKIIALNLNFVEQKSIHLNYSTDSYYPYFFKCIHLKEEIGIFIFYRLSLTKKSPILVFKAYDNNTKEFNDYLSLDSIKIKCSQIKFNKDSFLNDIIKISDEKICFTSTSDDKDKLYIVLIKIIDLDKVVIRFYSIDIYPLNNYKFLSEMRQHLYNNYISFAFSFCRQYSCSDSDPYYSGLMIFSYPNGTDYNLNLTNYLFNNNDIKIDNIAINLKENITIDNNVFGLVYKGIKIVNIIDCHNIDFVSSLNENKYINENYILDEDEDIKLKFSNNTIDNDICIIKYQYIISEPDFDEYNQFTIERQTFGDDTESTYFNNQKSDYESKILNYNIVINETLEKQCEIENCELCLQKQNYCITCKFKYDIIYEEEENIFRKNCLPKEKSDIQSNELSEIISNINGIETEKATTKNCTHIQIYNKCIDGEVTNEQLEKIFQQFKEEILAYYNGETKLILTENVIIEISTLDNQKDSLNPNVSTIDLGECENILKSEYHILNNESLIVLKIDIKNEDQTLTFIQYEILHPKNKTKLNLNLCDKVKIIINTPVKLSTETVSLYNSLNELGYNLFDSEDDFYNDICATYTSENSTDMILEDRKKEIYSSNGNITMCQSGCTFESYNEITKKAKCSCDVQIEEIETNLTKINFDAKSIGQNFLKTLKNSNFLVLKCYKLALNFQNIFKNKGRIVMTIIFFLFLFSLFFYIIKDRKQLIIYINHILKNKLFYENYEDNSENGNLNNKTKNKIKRNSNSIKKDKKENINNIIKNKMRKKKDDVKKNIKQKYGKKKPEGINENNNEKKERDQYEPIKRKSNKNSYNDNSKVNSRKSLCSSPSKLNKNNINIMLINNLNYKKKVVKEKKAKKKKNKDNNKIEKKIYSK